MIPIFNNANYKTTYIAIVYNYFLKINKGALLKELENNIKLVDSSLDFKKLLGLNISSFDNLQKNMIRIKIV